MKTLSAQEASPLVENGDEVKTLPARASRSPISEAGAGNGRPS